MKGIILYFFVFEAQQEGGGVAMFFTSFFKFFQKYSFTVPIELRND